MRAAAATIAALAAALAGSTPARADWRDPIAGGSVIRPARFEPGYRAQAVHAAPRTVEPAQNESFVRWSLPLVDRRLDVSERGSPLDLRLIEAILRIEPIYDPTLIEGPSVAVPMHVSAGTAETRDVFADHWRMISADANIDIESRPLASVWLAGAAARPCSAFRVRRRHDWGEAALSAPTLADCRAIRERQARAAVEAAPVPVAIAAPSLPVFAAPEPGSRLSSADFWTAQRERIANIREHLHRKWSSGSDGLQRADLRGPISNP